ncbi:ABC transporter permease [Comamonas kerstersii]|uniref:ABC transporter permease n=1 Tax=Comamonas kerstersii TaxID=225992 RepID=UPI0020C40F51|nr:ABC transporter permease [Comamonas kerstersii]
MNSMQACKHFVNNLVCDRLPIHFVIWCKRFFHNLKKFSQTAELLFSMNNFQRAAAVWKALFLREALVRMFSSRFAWGWVVLEPVVNILWLVLIFTVIRVRHIGGIETPLWIAIGMLVFMTFKRTVSQVQNAVDANSALFAYRQVRPSDVALVRAVLEGVTMLVISTAVFAVGGIFGWMALPAAPLLVLEAFLLAWLCGLGLGMCFAVLIKLVPELERIISFIMMPLMMISGVLFPLSMVRQPYLDWLLYNPLAHAIEAARLGFAPYYHAVTGLDVGYAYGCALVLNFMGLALFRRYTQRLVMQ